MSRERQLRSVNSTTEDYSTIITKVLESPTFIEKLGVLIAQVVKKEVGDVVQGLQNKVASLESELQESKQLVEDYKDRLEQYSRANSLRIFGVKENEGEDTNSVIMDIVKSKLKIDINIRDIDFTHRLGGKSGANNQRPRAIIVKFVNRHLRNKCLHNRSVLKHTNIVIKEDLTPKRAALLKMATNKFGFKHAWSSNGNIIVKINNIIHKIFSEKDLNSLINENAIS